MLDFSRFVHQLRVESGLGLRELCRRSDKHPLIQQPISSSYLSRIESGGGHNDLAKVSIDKLWALGIVLEVDPLLLFVIQHDLPPPLLDHGKRERLWTIVSANTGHVGQFVRSIRLAANLTIYEVSSLAKQDPAMFGISPPFLSQIETGNAGLDKTVSGEKLWAIGCVLKIHPLTLFVLSRDILVRPESVHSMFR